MQRYLIKFNSIKFKGLKHIALTLFFLFSTFTQAQEFESNELKNISESTEWLNLIRFEPKLLKLDKVESAISSKDYFLSPIGNKDSYAELIATIKASKIPFSEIDNKNNHPLCKFPARYKWLHKKLGLNMTTDLLKECPAYSKWSQNGKVTSISAYFITGFLGNPASFFGHSLITFNTSTSANSLLDGALNYGAVTPQNENPLKYVIKGIFGGYNAVFSKQDFYYHNHNYTEEELRDLWEYKLNLTQQEVDWVVDRTWELVGKDHPYYFFVDNCAYRMGQILEEVFEAKLFHHNRLYTPPIDIFKNLAVSKKSNGEPMVLAINFIPSRYNRFVESHQEMSNEEVRIFNQLFSDKLKVDSKPVSSLNHDSQRRILNSLINYYSFKVAKSKNDPTQDADLKQKRTLLLTSLLKLPIDSKVKPAIESEKVSPEKAQKTLMLRNEYSFHESKLSRVNLTVRPAMFDELNPSIGRSQNSALSILESTLTREDSKWTLSKIDVFRINALNSPLVRLPDEIHWAWKVRLGVQNFDNWCSSCKVGLFEGGLGQSFQLVRNLETYFILNVGINSPYLNNGNLFAGPEFGLNYEPTYWWKINASVFRKIRRHESRFENHWKFETRFGSSTNWDIRLSYEKEATEYYGLGLSVYL